MDRIAWRICAFSQLWRALRTAGVKGPKAKLRTLERQARIA
jgi:hypothetical protein